MIQYINIRKELCLWLIKSHYSVCSQKTAVKFVLRKKIKFYLFSKFNYKT